LSVEENQSELKVLISNRRKEIKPKTQRTLRKNSR
jgi:hypothetical protein